MPCCWVARTEIDGYMAESDLPAQALEADPVWTRGGDGRKSTAKSTKSQRATSIRAAMRNFWTMPWKSMLLRPKP